RIFVTRRIHGGIFPRMPVIRLDPTEESVSSCEFLTRYERATSYDIRTIYMGRGGGVGTCIPYTQIERERERGGERERERETLIFIVPYAGRPAKTPGDSQS
ncbi:hypothetical protein ALC56_10437, partial [Trachymyrmex septentrionalis]